MDSGRVSHVHESMIDLGVTREFLEFHTDIHSISCSEDDLHDITFTRNFV